MPAHTLRDVARITWLARSARVTVIDGWHYVQAWFAGPIARTRGSGSALFLAARRRGRGRGRPRSPDRTPIRRKSRHCATRCIAARLVGGCIRTGRAGCVRCRRYRSPRLRAARADNATTAPERRNRDSRSYFSSTELLRKVIGSREQVASLPSIEMMNLLPNCISQDTRGDAATRPTSPVEHRATAARVGRRSRLAQTICVRRWCPRS
jgi:hypothetical protein